MQCDAMRALRGRGVGQLEGWWRGADRGGARLGPEPALKNFTGEGRLLLSAFALHGWLIFDGLRKRLAPGPCRAPPRPAWTLTWN